MDQATFTCSNCGSDQLVIQKRGFDVEKAIIGDLIAGPIGILAGNIESNDSVVTCLICGNVFYPQRDEQPSEKESTKTPEVKPVKELSNREDLKFKKQEPINETFQEVFSVIFFFVGIVIIGFLLYKRFF